MAGAGGRGREAGAAPPDLPLAGARWRYLAAALSGLLLAASFPPLGWRHLSFLALVPWFSLLLRDGGRGHRGPAYLFGLLYFTAGFWWLAPLLLVYPFALAGVMALYPLLFAEVVFRTAPLGPVRTALLLPCAWVGVDLLREHLLTGFPWLLPGHALAGLPDLRQAADLGGAHLLTFLVVLSGSAGGLLGAHALRRRRKIGLPRAARWGLPAAALLLPLLLAGYGSHRRAGIRDLPGPRVLLVQPSFPQGLKGEAREGAPSREEMRNGQLALSIEGVTRHADTDLVVWAETMVPEEIRERARDREGPDRDSLHALHRIADPVGVVPGSPRRLLAGAVVRGGDLGKRNSGLLVGPGGAVEGRFDKVHLTPVGEYLPLVHLLPEGARRSVEGWVLSVSPFLPDMVPGRSAPVPLEVPGAGTVRLGGLICYEVLFPGLARERVREGADVLVNLSNYAWYGSGMREQALDFARLRAVETRRPVVVATNDGPTAVVDGNGEVRKRLPEGARAFLHAAVPLDGRSTLYASTGDVLAAVLAAAALLGAGWGVASGRRGPRGGAGKVPGAPENC